MARPAGDDRPRRDCTDCRRENAIALPLPLLSISARTGLHVPAGISSLHIERRR